MSMPRLPRLTHLQFLVLGLLHDGEQPGRLLPARRASRVDPVQTLSAR